MPLHALGAKMTSERWTKLPIMSGQQRSPPGETGGLRSYVLRFVPWKNQETQATLKDPQHLAGLFPGTNVARS